MEDKKSVDFVSIREVEKVNREFLIEIFAEIEKIAYINGEGDLFLDLSDFVELKKKYILN